MELILIKPNSTEWEYMWEWLDKHPINEGLEVPSVGMNEGEGWQYVGSFKEGVGSYKQGERVVHHLRHRKHPKINGVYTLTLSASESFTGDQIEKNFRL